MPKVCEERGGGKVSLPRYLVTCADDGWKKTDLVFDISGCVGRTCEKVSTRGLGAHKTR